MKKILSLIILAILLSPNNSGAAEVGDIYFHDKTFGSSVGEGKLPIGMVFWVSKSKNHGLVMQLNQPAAIPWTDARAYCANLTTLGTKIGDWHLPSLMEMLRMSKSTWGGGTTDNKFNYLNNKLTALTGIGEAMVAANYHTFAANGGVMLNPSTGVPGYAGSLNTGTQRARCVMAF